mmetsp:Transcript_67380/g.206369  ORF Transcript_67380/g.206369 Transcript_67380/m.206369 type:complete len:274 (+) Transcript_67380:155-976(+)
MPIATEKLAMVGGPWSGKRRATKLSRNPPNKLENALPQLNMEKIQAVCVWVKHDSSNHCVKKGNTVHGADPGAPWHRIRTNVGYVNNCQTLGKFFTNTEHMPALALWASSPACGSWIQASTAAPMMLLNAARAMTLTRQPCTPNTVTFAKLVATKPKSVLHTWPTKNNEPNAEPRFVGGFLSATRLNNNGCTTPKPMPLRTRPMKSISKLDAIEHTTNPVAQNSMPAPINWGRGNISPKKPQGNEKAAAVQPFTVLNILSWVCETWNKSWYSL